MIAANTATVSPNGGGAITYTYYTDSACSVGATTTAPTNVGTYYVKASVAAVSNKTNAASSSCVNHSIVKSNTTTSLSAITKTYNGNNQAASGATAKLSSNNAAAPSAAFTYKYYTDSSCSAGETTTAPKAAGQYYVKATLTGTSNYNTSSSSCVSYIMNKKALTISAYSTSWVSGTTTYTRSNYETAVNSEKITLTYTPNANIVGSYTYATTTGSGKYLLSLSDSTNYSVSSAGNLTLNPVQVNPVTNLAVSNAGIVTWTNSSNATGYEISIDGTNWTTATNGINYLSTIIESTGSRSVHVRAINSDTTNYTSPSEEATATITVNSLTGTFYYNSNTTSGSTTVSTKTATCKAISGGNCSLTIPTEVTESGGTYNNKYVGVATTTGTVTSSTTVTLNADAKRYAVYRTEVTIYYPSSTSATTSKKVYQNQWFTSDSDLATTVLSTTTTGTTTNATAATAVSDYTTLVGFNASASQNTATYATIAALAQIDSGRNANMTVYEIDKKTENIEATFYYQSSTTSGTRTISTATASGTKTTFLRPTSTSAAGISVSDGTIAIPSVVTESGGIYNNKYGGVARQTGTMARFTATTAYTKYYALYSTQITIYFPMNDGAVSKKQTYQNQWFMSDSSLSTTVLSTTNMGTSTDATAGAVVSGYDLMGFSNSVNTTAINSQDIATLARTNSGRSSSRNVYQVERKQNTSVTVSFNHSIDETGTPGGTTKNYMTYTYLRCTSTSASGTTSPAASITSSSIPSNATSATAPYGTSLIGWATSPTTMTPATSLNTGTRTYYAVYRSEVANYYYDGTEYTTRTLYRNSYHGSEAKYTMVLSETDTGTSNYTAEAGPGSSTWIGLSTASDTTPEYTNIGTYNTGAAYSSIDTFYTVYQFDVNYSKGSNISSVGLISDSCKVNATSASTGTTSCNVILPSITPDSGYTVNGWSSTKDDATGIDVGSFYTIDTNSKTLYGNAVGIPTFQETVQGEVVITYPSGCSTYTCQYSMDNGSTWTTVTSSSTTVYVGVDNGVVLARGSTTSLSTSYTVVRNKLYISSSGDDSIGAGTINKPYATIGKSYTSGASTSTIYAMSNVTAASTATMGSSKTITLTSCTKSGSGASATCPTSSAYTITRDSAFTGNLINETTGALTLNTITLDGNNVANTSPLINNASGASLNVNSNATLKNNKASSSGGAIVNGGTLTIAGGTIINNTSGGNGGGIYTTGNLTMSSGTITSNQATSSGGGIAVVKNSSAPTITLSGGTISSNTASYGGGILNGASSAASADSTLKIQGVTISNNTSNNSGGGIYSGSKLTMTSGTISGNTAATYGGGFISKTDATMSGGTVTGNNAKANSGGGIHSDGALTVSSGTIEKNTAGANGGGISGGTSSTITLSGGTIGGSSATYKNSAPNGGGVSASAGITISNASIKYNTATTTGGGIYKSGTTKLTLNSGTIEGNTAPNGGGLYNTGTAEIKGGSIIKNVATTSGGGVYNSGTLTMSAGTIGGSAANKNTATNTSSSFGAGIYNSKSLTMTGGSVTYNVSSSKGGGIANIGSSNTFSMTSPANVSYNQSTSHGGGIYCSAGTSTMNSGTVKNNKTTSQFGGGYYLTSSAVLYLKGGNVDSNTAGGGGGGIAIGNSSTATTQTTLNMSGGTVSSNSIVNASSSNGTGGGIHSAANTKISITSGTISSNKSQSGKGQGGALFTSGTVTLSGGTIASNVASSKGGAWFCNNGTCTVSGATIKKNTASTSDGGIFKNTNGTYSRTSGYVCKNNSPTNSYDVTATSDSHCS